jgi:hypothetical protein
MLGWFKPRNSAADRILDSGQEEPSPLPPRQAAYAERFGPCAEVQTESIPFDPQIDLCIYPPAPQKGRDFYTLITSGMSDRPMTVPADTDAPRRAELVFYSLEPKEDYLNFLRWLAHYPHSYNTWLGFGHSIANGAPAQPIAGSSLLTHFLFIPTMIPPDARMASQLYIQGERVQLLWVVPISTAEANFKQRQGAATLIKIFDQQDHPLVYNPTRPTYV